MFDPEKSDYFPDSRFSFNSRGTTSREYAHASVCVSAGVSIHVYMLVCMFVCACALVYVNLRVCLCVWFYIKTNVRMI